MTIRRWNHCLSTLAVSASVLLYLPACSNETLPQRVMASLPANVERAQRFDTAIQRGDRATLEGFIAQGYADPLAIVYTGIMYGPEELVLHYLPQVDANTRPLQGEFPTLLHLSVSFCRPAVTNELLKRGANPNATSPSGEWAQTPLDSYREAVAMGSCFWATPMSPPGTLAQGKEAAILVARAGGKVKLTTDQVIEMAKGILELFAENERKIAAASVWYADFQRQNAANRQSRDASNRAALIEITNALTEIGARGKR